MSAEEMGKLTKRTRLVFAASSLVFLAVLAISPFKDFRREWKQNKRSYLRFAQTRPDTKKLVADYHADIDQIWLPGMNVVDRCTTCHQGITQASLADPCCPSAVPRPPADPAQRSRLGLHHLPSRPGPSHGSGRGS